MNANQRTHLKYADARPLIRNADQLLWRPISSWGPAGIFSRSIAGRAKDGGRGYSHAAKVMLVGLSKRLIVIEEHGKYGCRTVPLSTYVTEDSGLIDVYEPNANREWPHYSRARAIDQMLGILAKPYPWHQIRVMHWARILRHWGLTTIYTTDEPGDENRLVCSGACAWADRQRAPDGKPLADPFPGKACRSVEPNDFANNPFYGYKFTLIADKVKGDTWEG